MLLRGRDSLILRFGEYLFNVKSGELSKAGRPGKLQPQPAKVLGLLASHSGHLLSREEIRAQVWGSETHVDFEQGLNYCIKQIRLALDDDADAPH